MERQSTERLRAANRRGWTRAAFVACILSMLSWRLMDAARGGPAALAPDMAIPIDLPADSSAAFFVPVDGPAVADLRLVQGVGAADLQLRTATGEVVDVRTESGATGAVEVPLLGRRSPVWHIVVAGRKGKGRTTALLQLSAARPATAADELRSTAFAEYVAAERLRYLNYRETKAVPRSSEVDERTRAAYRHAIADYEASADECGIRRAAIGLARFAAAIGEYADSRAAASDALRARCNGDLAEQAQALKTLGMAAAYQGDFSASAQAAEQALALYRQTGDLRYQGIVLGNLSDVYMQSGATDRALGAALGALGAAEATGDRAGVVFSQESIGAIHLARGELADALQSYRATLGELAVTPYPMIEAETMNDLGIVYHRMADYPQALRSYAAAQAVWAKMHNRFGHADTLINQAQLLLEIGKPHSAMRKFNEALDIARQDGLKGPQTAALRGLGAAFFAAGNVDVARRHALASLRLARTTAELAPQSYALRMLATLDYAEGRTAAARRNGEAALKLAREAADRDGEATTLQQLARIRADAGAPLAALGLIRQALAIIETQRGRINDPGLRTSYFSSVRGFSDVEIEILMQLAQRFPGRDYAAAALAASERARARTLQDRLADKAVDLSQSVDAALLEEERSAEERLRTAAFRLSRLGAGSGAERRGEFLEAIDAASHKLDEVRGRMRSENPRYADLLRPLELHVPDVQQRYLDDDTAIVEYWFGERASYAWIVSRRSLRAVRLPRRALIEPLASALRRLCRTPGFEGSVPGFDALARTEAEHSTAIRRAAEQLAGVVLGTDVVRGLPRKLAVIVDSSLDGVPLGLLPTAATGGTLGGQHELVYLPSISTLSWLRRRTSGWDAGHVSVAVFADPVLAATDLAPLPNARPEARDLAGMLPGKQVVLALGNDASRARVMAIDWRRFNIVHFATHAIVDVQRPELSGIVLSSQDQNGRAQDGMLRMGDIYNLDMPVDLVVLSGCETAGGRGVESEGVLSLSRAFFYAGASRVLASLWSVDDRATAAFMHEFYEGMLLEHMTPATALKFAQQRMSGDRRWSAPYYWAGFVLQGDWG